MAIADVLKGMRSNGFSKKTETPEKDDSDEKKSGPRTIMLSQDEIKGIGEGAKPGEDIEITVSGKLENDGHFHIMEVKSAGGMPDEKDMASQVMNQMQPPGMPGMG